MFECDHIVLVACKELGNARLEETSIAPMLYTCVAASYREKKLEAEKKTGSFCVALVLNSTQQKMVPCVKTCGCEGRTIITEVGLRNHSMISTESLKTLLGTKSLVNFKMRLKFDMNKVGGMMHKDATTIIHCGINRFPT